MPRKTTKEESAEYMQMFFDQARDRLKENILKTMQPKRRREMINKGLAIDLVEAEFYDWANGIDTDAT